MKRLIIACLMVASGCSVDNSLNNEDLSGRWEALWQVDGETLRGEFVLLNNGFGSIEILGQKGSILMSQEVSADFRWQKEGSSFNLERLDNDFKMSYRILKESRYEIDMTFADEVYIKLTKE